MIQGVQSQRDAHQTNHSAAMLAVMNCSTADDAFITSTASEIPALGAGPSASI